MCLLLERKFFSDPKWKFQQKPKSCGIYKHGESQEKTLFSVYLVKYIYIIYHIYQKYIYIIWFLFMVHSCKIIISPCIFFVFWVVRGVKGQKIVQNDKKFCLSHSIFQEPYIMRSSFMVHKYKIIIFSGILFFLLKFWFFGLLGGSKNGPKWQKSSVVSYISRTIHHMIFIHGTHVEEDNISMFFFTFYRSFIFWSQ